MIMDTSASAASDSAALDVTATAPTKRPTRRTRWQSRAVSRTVDAGNAAYCAVCDEFIKFRARIRAEQIICNVYVNNRWDRVEHYHPECYEQAGFPYGKPQA
ncbi:hypothetical protein [Candidatus Poriferisodalis sp.]|uniref:hypothetical protein n=1 Tax=Candidatus Poriferisodalis sp. TaxID=3101277 RepID=UPI003B0151D0